MQHRSNHFQSSEMFVWLQIHRIFNLLLKRDRIIRTLNISAVFVILCNLQLQVIRTPDISVVFIIFCNL